MRKKIIVLSLVAILFFMAPAHSFAASSSSFLGQLQGLLTSLVKPATPSSSSSPAQSAAQGTPPPTSSSGAPTIGLPFGGPITFGPIKCDIPKGATYVVVGSPVSKPLLCQKGICKTYDFQPPYKFGQYLLGVALPSVPITCVVGLSPVGAGFPIGMTPGVGAAGSASSGNGGEKGASENSCPQEQFQINNSFTKQEAEVAVREKLAGLGIGINNTSCGYGQRFQIYRAIFGRGCTDVSNLQCASTNYLQSLAETCGAGSVVVTGGSELGHNTHDSGNAVDLSVKGTSLQSCLDTKTDRFTNLGGGKYKDKKTNSIFTFETGELHYHVCIPGSGC